MAQKAAKSTATRNAAVLRRTHLLSLAINALYLLLRLIIFRKSLTTRSLLKYVLFSLPAFGIEAVFERNSRPQYVDGKMQRSGDDLEAKGLTEWMWDVLYWTWGCVVLAAVLGDWAWWLYTVIPVYSAWLAYSTFGNVRQMFGGAGLANNADGAATSSSTSKRQQKMEKRGAKVQYR